MSKVTSSWARPIQGISQQPPKTMKEGQCREQINMLPGAVRGLEKRIGTDLVKVILPTLEPDAIVHHYRRGDGEEYFIVLESDGVPKVFGVDGVQHVVQVNSGTAYCKDTNPKQSIAMQTIADYTFLVNKGVTVEKDPVKSPVALNEAMVYMQYATYGRKYKVYINGDCVAQYDTPDGSLSTHINKVDINYVCTQLAYGNVMIPTHVKVIATDTFTPGANEGDPAILDGCTITLPTQAQVLFIYEEVSGAVHTIGSDASYLEGVITLPASASGLEMVVVYQMPGSGGLSSLDGFSCVQYGASFHITRIDGAPFEIYCEDGAQGKDLICIKEFVTGAENLPPSAPDGFLIQVRGKGKKLEDAFYLKAVNSGSSTRWVESIAPDQQYRMKASTLPVTIIRDSVDINGIATFIVDVALWVDRDVGADDSNPWPTFVGNVIHSVGIFQNRLFFTSSEAVCMTRTGQFFNFFRESTQLISADDPLDVYADSPQINNLLHSVSMDGDLVFFSPNAQFLLPGTKPVTKENVTLKQTNNFKIQTAISPVPSGESVYFAYDNGMYSGIRELFTDNIIDTKRARPVTEHVDKLIVGTIRTLVSSTNLSWLMLTADAPNIIYMYNWLWVGQEKAQSAWHKWVWPDTDRIDSITISQDKVYFFITRPDGVYLESINVGDSDSYGLPFPVRLDRKQTVTATKVGTKWVWPDPMPREKLVDVEYVVSTGGYPEMIGASVYVTRKNDGTLFTEDSISSGTTCTLVCGCKYTSTFVPAQPVVKDYKDRVIEVDKLKLAQVFLNYETTGYLKVSVADIYGQTDVSEFAGRYFGDTNNIVGFAPLMDGQFNFPVLQEADKVTITITSDSYLPLRIRDMEYTGQFTQRGRRL